MKKYALILLSLLAMTSGFSQSRLWKGYFSYRSVKDLSQSTTKVVAATENALFSKEVFTGQIKTTNTIDGLSGQTISAVYHSPTFKKTLVGYENGLMIVINDLDGSMLNVVDIINKQLPPNIKKVNHFMEHDGIVYVSCDFGIVQYNLRTLVFGDTYFIGNVGAQIVIKQTTVFNNKIYAATAGYGIRVADINNPNLNDYNQWTTLDGNGWNGVEAFGTELMAVTNTGGLQRFQGANFAPFLALPETAVDIRSSANHLIVTTANHIYVYDSGLVQVRHLTSSELAIPGLTFSCATLVSNSIYIGTVKNGLFSTGLMPSAFEDLTPSGPVRNNIFSIEATPNALWAVYGGYDENYNPYTYEGGMPLELPVSKFSNSIWLDIPYASLFGAKALVRVTANPNNENQVFVSSFHSGLLKIENNTPMVLYTEANSTLDEIGPATLRIDGTAFDKNGNLWVTNSMVDKGLKVLRADGQWGNGFSMSGLYANVGEFNLGRLTVDKNGTKWMVTRDEGVIGYNEAYNPPARTIKDGSESGNLPHIEAKVAAIDNRNQLWIGTRSGLRVLSSVDNFMSGGQLNTDAIIIIEDNLAQELLYEQSIRDIVVDGSNNKWIGTVDSGVFLVSPNGQRTIYHFTKDNSPLPSNIINDIAINGKTGEVFFATEKGMVSFKGTATDAADNLSNVYVYPNPVRPEFNGTVKVSGLIDKANVKIADIEGNLVFETISEGGTIEWDTTAFGKYKVASGVYMIFISAEDGGETKVKKVMIVR
ncbi:T9SS type A sorting domain-containing protein [Flavobacterium sp.]|uniref:type IX secretion system anionic LPS delivery protein PorZ n=1 Tax=Flavobacterium sp. TaxID=239 RepID=UPI0039E60574